MIGEACNISLCASFMDLVVNHCMMSYCSKVWSIFIPATSAKLFHTYVANAQLLKMCSIVSQPDLLLQQKHLTGLMPNLISFSLVGSLPLRSLHTKCEALKGIFLCQIRELKEDPDFSPYFILGSRVVELSIVIELTNGLVL